MCYTAYIYDCGHRRNHRRSCDRYNLVPGTAMLQRILHDKQCKVTKEHHRHKPCRKCAARQQRSHSDSEESTRSTSSRDRSKRDRNKESGHHKGGRTGANRSRQASRPTAQAASRPVRRPSPPVEESIDRVVDARPSQVHGDHDSRVKGLETWLGDVARNGGSDETESVHRNPVNNATGNTAYPAIAPSSVYSQDEPPFAAEVDEHSPDYTLSSRSYTPVYAPDQSSWRPTMAPAVQDTAGAVYDRRPKSSVFSTGIVPQSKPSIVGPRLSLPESVYVTEYAVSEGSDLSEEPEELEDVEELEEPEEHDGYEEPEEHDEHEEPKEPEELYAAEDDGPWQPSAPDPPKFRIPRKPVPNTAPESPNFRIPRKPVPDTTPESPNFRIPRKPVPNATPESPNFRIPRKPVPPPRPLSSRQPLVLRDPSTPPEPLSSRKPLLLRDPSRPPNPLSPEKPLPPPPGESRYANLPATASEVAAQVEEKEHAGSREQSERERLEKENAELRKEQESLRKAMLRLEERQRQRSEDREEHRTSHRRHSGRSPSRGHRHSSREGVYKRQKSQSHRHSEPREAKPPKVRDSDSPSNRSKRQSSHRHHPPTPKYIEGRWDEVILKPGPAATPSAVGSQALMNPREAPEPPSCDDEEEKGTTVSLFLPRPKPAPQAPPVIHVNPDIVKANWGNRVGASQGKKADKVAHEGTTDEAHAALRELGKRGRDLGKGLLDRINSRKEESEASFMCVDARRQTQEGSLQRKASERSPRSSRRK